LVFINKKGLTKWIPHFSCQGPDRDEKFWFFRKHPWIGFPGRTGIRFCDQYRIAICTDLFLIAIMIAIAVSKSGSDCAMKIADRFADQNR